MRLLGSFEIALTDGTTPARLGAKAQGLLAVLATARGQLVSRARLAGLLWGERDEGLARHSLNQALTTVRAALGPGASDLLQTCPEGVLLAREGLELDLAAFEEAARSHERAALEQACRLYRGEFLEGLEIREPGFEEWMLTERYRLRELAADAFARLLDLQTGAGDADAAIETARRLVALTPLEESAHARLIRLYGAQGRRGLAEAHYRRCADLLQRDLGQGPGDQLRSALREARRAQPGSARVEAGPISHESAGPPARPARASGRARMRRTLPATAAALALLVGGLAWMLHENGVGDAESYESAPWELPDDPSIAVLPFDNHMADAGQDYFVDGITAEVITKLSKFPRLFVTSAASSFRYKGEAVKAQDVARDLGVRYLLKGSVQSNDRTLQINVSLIDATSGRNVWAELYERPTDNLFAVQKEITQTVAAMVGSGGGELQQAELQRIADNPTEDLHAYDLYLRGAAYAKQNTREDNALARQMFGGALQIDPNYARAMADLSMTYISDLFNGWTDSRQDTLREAEELARRSIENDPSEPWGFVALGLVYQLKGQSAQALPLFEKANALNPNDYYVKEALGFAVTFAGRAERGVELLEEAQRLNPYHTSDHPLMLGGAYFFAQRYEDAVATINRITSRQESSGYWLYKAASHAQVGQLDQAHAAVAEALKLDPGLTLESEHERRLALGLAPAYAEDLTQALRKAGLPEGATH